MNLTPFCELNPVRAGMVAIAGDYPWSSYHVNALGRHEARIQPHASFQTLGADDHARREATGN
jgi:putative transposase